MSDTNSQATATAPTATNAATVTPPPPAHSSAWAPLSVPIFRAIWLAYLVSLVGTWAREAGGPWLMTLLTQNRPDQAFWVSLVQTAGTLPICFLSIAAGVLADIYDRRKLLIITHLWMLLASFLLAFVTLAGWTTPHLLLAITLLLGIGAAMAGPAFQFVVPELVPSQQLPQAIGLNSVALNIARAVGPALGMGVIVLVGRSTGAGDARATGASFLINALAFIGVIAVLIRWNRAPQRQGAYRETLWGATRVAFRYTAHSPALRAILIRVAAFILCAVIVWAQLAIVARKQLGGGEGTFGILMAAVGLGAVVGVFFMPRLEKRFSTDGMVAICTALFGLALIGLSQCKGSSNATAFAAAALALVIGFNWVIVPTNFNIATQRSVPNWVKGRAIAMYMTVLFGSFALGSPLWGALASKIGISNASLIAGALILLGLLLVKPFPLTRGIGQDFAPAPHRPDLDPPPDFLPGRGAVQVVITYLVEPDRAAEFATLMHRQLRPQRLRNGAARWHLEMTGGDEQRPAAFTEILTFSNWTDRQRSLARTTRADAALEERAAAYHNGLDRPAARYLALDAPAHPLPPGKSEELQHATEPQAAAEPDDLTAPPIIDWQPIIEHASTALDTLWNRLLRQKFRK